MPNKWGKTLFFLDKIHQRVYIYTKGSENICPCITHDSGLIYKTITQEEFIHEQG